MRGWNSRAWSSKSSPMPPPDHRRTPVGHRACPPLAVWSSASRSSGVAGIPPDHTLRTDIPSARPWQGPWEPHLSDVPCVRPNRCMKSFDSLATQGHSRSAPCSAARLHQLHRWIRAKQRQEAAESHRLGNDLEPDRREPFMALKYRILPAHRRELRQLRSFVKAAGPGARASDLQSAISYLEVHASCETYALADFNGPEPSKRPRCGVVNAARRRRASSTSKKRSRAARPDRRRDADEVFLRQMRQSLGLKTSLALDKSRSTKNGGHEVAGGLPGLGKRN